jgi:hypothetical protein
MIGMSTFWRGCELDSGFLSCVAEFYPVTFWVTVSVAWTMVVFGLMLWRSRR